MAYTGLDTGSPSREWLHADERGSIVAHSDDAGARSALMAYDEFGMPAGAYPHIWQTTGQAKLDHPWLHHYKTRAFNNQMQAFMQPDTIGLAGGPNLYAYLGGDGVNNRDPWGMMTCGDDPETPEDEDADCEDVTQVVGRRIAVPFWAMGSSFSNWRFGGRGAGGDSGSDEGDPHFFQIDVPALCSAEDAFAQMRQPHRSAPGAPYAQDGETNGVDLAGDNPITQIVNPGNLTIRNVTEDDHVFSPGWVLIEVVRVPFPNRSRIRISGSGTGGLPSLNNAVGLSYFEVSARAAAAACSQGD